MSICVYVCVHLCVYVCVHLCVCVCTWHWWEIKTVQLPWRTVCQYLLKLSVHLPLSLAIPLLGIYPREIKSYDGGVSRCVLPPGLGDEV